MLSNLSFKDVHWKVQDSDEESILFYRIGSNSGAKDQFLERIKTAKFKVLVVNQNLHGLPENSMVVSEEDWMKAQAEACDRVYPLPKLRFIAITGTNGKTTTTDLVLQLGEKIGKRGLSIGTLGVRSQGKTLNDFGLTSPSYIDLRKFLFQYGKDKDFCVMEASSHALTQDRLYGLVFDAAGFLSFSQDHLDYHKTMEEYFAAKCLLFKQLSTTAKLFVPEEQKELFEKLKIVSAKTAIAPPPEGDLPLFFQPQFNQNNLAVATAIIEDLFGKKVSDFKALLPPDGRFFIRSHRSNYIVVDFAHTPDALENVCASIKKTFPQHRLKVLFGCGGDRDRTKRPLMGEVANRLADFSYVTSDNPRSEDPSLIIDDITQGMPRHNFVKIVERREAVKKAFSELTENEVLLLAGKGHEDYILKNGIKTHYSDIEEVETFLGNKP